MLWNLNMLQLALIPSYAASWCFLAFYTLVYVLAFALSYTFLWVLSGVINVMRCAIW